MAELLSIDQAARRCSVSRDTIKRRLRAGRFPGAVRGTPVGRRPAPWLIPDEDLVAERLLTGRQVELAQPPEAADDDPGALRAALAHYQVLATARGAHLEDLRAEVRRLHERLDQLTAAFLAITPTAPSHSSEAIAPGGLPGRSTAPNRDGGA
ncbi:MAG: helix-turn-helix transcriptional regulator [Acidimicrobiales bacterium]